MQDGFLGCVVYTLQTLQPHSPPYAFTREGHNPNQAVPSPNLNSTAPSTYSTTAVTISLLSHIPVTVQTILIVRIVRGL